MQEPDKVADLLQGLMVRAGQGTRLFAGPNGCRSVQELDEVADSSQGLMVADLFQSRTRYQTFLKV